MESKTPIFDALTDHEQKAVRRFVESYWRSVQRHSLGGDYYAPEFASRMNDPQELEEVAGSQHLLKHALKEYDVSNNRGKEPHR
jgi:hypothetical protein